MGSTESNAATAGLGKPRLGSAGPESATMGLLEPTELEPMESVESTAMG